MLRELTQQDRIDARRFIAERREYLEPPTPMQRLIADSLACPGLDESYEGPNDYDEDDKESDAEPQACGAD